MKLQMKNKKLYLYAHMINIQNTTKLPTNILNLIIFMMIVEINSIQNHLSFLI
jgi:hypothetical protein